VIRQYELVERVRSYDKNADERLLNRAYVFSMKAHGTQTRISGDPYFSHPLEVAGILTDMRLDGATIVTALLHDTIEDTVATFEEIRQLFGPEIARLVDGVTKLSQIEFDSESVKQAENFRKFLLAMSDDIRVLLVKLADRLHNMRTLHYIKRDEKRRRIALETMEIYAPLAERIGMQALKDELEDLAFAELNPDARNSLVARLEYLRKKSGSLKGRVVRELKRTLKKAGISATVMGREKRPYSIWNKMEHNNVAFEALSDVMAFRILVKDEADCYAALGVVHRRWPMVPGRFKDYISTPKQNGYQSIHTTVIGLVQHRIEIQIRTEKMHEVAEYGVAAHWQYKQKVPKGAGRRQYRWLRELLEILEQAASPEEFLEHTKIELFQDQVFCFTPKGDLLNLPRGATPVDFAYAVHTEVGDTCVGAKVNGRIVPLRTRLKNGDQVEIVRSKAQTPSPIWESFVVTGKARAAIRRFIRHREREQYIGLGRSLIQKAFSEEGHEAEGKALAKTLKLALKPLGYDSIDDLFEALGQGLVGARSVLESVFPGETLKGTYPHVIPSPLDRARVRKAGDHAIPIKGLIPGMAVHMADCCYPLPGDRIVGIVTAGRGITVHTIDCELLENFAETPERWVDISWEREAENVGLHYGRVSAMLANEPGALGAVASVVGKNHGNISNLKIIERHPQYFNLILDIEVRNLKHLTNIIAALRATRMVNSVERLRG